MIYRMLRPALFQLDAERAHRLTLFALKVSPLRRTARPQGPLATRVAGLDFSTPLGMAAGFDKDAEVPDALLGLGFGFAEVGSITPLPQAGNPKPRLFRLVEDRAVINRMGFNNGGGEAAAARLRARAGRPGVVGINIGANKDSDDWVGDYVTGLQRFSGLGDYYTINISSPNTPGLRALQTRDSLKPLLDALIATREQMSRVRKPPLLVKLAAEGRTFN